MSSHRPRGYSPPRYYGDQPRATTGTVYASSFDTGSRGGSSSLPRASVSTVSSGRHNVAYQAQPMRKSTYADGKTRTEYAIRPKNETSAPVDNRRPLSISTAPMSPTRHNMNVLASPREMTPTAVRDDSSRMLQPASAYGHHHGFHQRHNSTSMADLDQREVDSERREKKYHPRPPYVQRVYDERVPARTSDDEWSYTGPREQFDRDFPQDSPGHRLTSRRERPTRDYEIDRSAPRRDPAPVPVNGRTPEKRAKGEANRHDVRTGFDSDPDHRSEAPRRRPSIRQPVVHQQPGRDDGYSSAKDDYGPRTYTSQRSSRYEDDDKPRVRPRDRYQEDDRVRDYDRKYHNDKNRDRDLDRDQDRDRDRHRDRDREREREREPDRDRDRDRDRERPRDYEKDYRDSKEYDRDYNRNYDRGYTRDERNDRDDRDETHDRAQMSRRSKPRSRDSSPERSGLKGLATGALGTLAAAGVVKGLTRDQKEKDAEPDDDEPRERRRRKHRRRSRTEDQENASEQEAERRKDDRTEHRQQESSSSDTPEDQPPRRRHSHSHRRRRDDDDSKQSRRRDDEDNTKQSRRRDDEDTGRERRYRDDEDAGKERLAITDGHADRDDSRVRTRDEEETNIDADRSSRELVPVPRQDIDTDYLETRTMSPGENEDDRPRRVQLVEPVKDKEESKPRGILKPARQVPFPEDPNPIREGVAPLKDASKDGIPPNARWTKINRVLVNPEALERYHERFEERDDYVIVLRVLTREEIKKFADKTKEIREAREKEWQQKLEERRRRQPANEGGSSELNDEPDYGDDGAGSRSQLAIEQSPTPPADFHNLQNAPSQQFPPRTMSSGPPVPDINVEANYSQNV